jgi:hypothetical protein
VSLAIDGRQICGDESARAMPFLHNHAAGIGTMDFLIVPTIGFWLLFLLVVLRHQRRRLISLSVTAHPTAEWIARRVTNAFPSEICVPKLHWRAASAMPPPVM